jgi:pimeloyl-ACP methyl ester carboxylesterase
VLPIFKLPVPTGPYAIGTRTLYFHDAARSNTLLQTGPPTGRDLAVQIWYPAEPSKNPFAPYRLRTETELRTSYMNVVPTHSRQDAPVLQDGAPWHVLLFNPAWDSRRGQSTALVEELASHGYVVAAIDHPGRTGPISLPDGRLIPVVPDPDLDDEAHSSVAGIEASLQHEVDKEAADDSFVLDQLALQNDNPSSPLHGKLDTQHAAALGHSLGAAVAADACALDPRLLSAFSMSAPFYGKVRTTGLRKPYFNISEGSTLASPGQLAHMDYANRIDSEADILDEADYNRLIRAYGGYAVKMRGINHSSFSDKAFYSPLRSLSGVGETPRDRVQFILRQYALQFFGKTLRGEPAPLFDDPTTTPTHPFPEVTQQYFPGSRSLSP